MFLCLFKICWHFSLRFASVLSTRSCFADAKSAWDLNLLLRSLLLLLILKPSNAPDTMDFPLSRRDCVLTGTIAVLVDGAVVGAGTVAVLVGTRTGAGAGTLAVLVVGAGAGVGATTMAAVVDRTGFDAGTTVSIEVVV